MQVQLVTKGWCKRSYRIIADGLIIGQLDYAKSYLKKANASINGIDFEIRRSGWWKHFIEISSATHQEYNMRIPVSWRSRMEILDGKKNPYTFKSTSIWQTKWGWFDRYDRLLIEMRSKSFSKKKRGLINIKHQEMKDSLFWIIVSWFVILCADSDGAAAAAA